MNLEGQGDSFKCTLIASLCHLSYLCPLHTYCLVAYLFSVESI